MLTNSDYLSVECFSKKVETLDAEFKGHHYAVIASKEKIEQQLDKEQVVMDDHEHMVADITECLEQFRPETKVSSLAARSTCHSHLMHG